MNRWRTGTGLGSALGLAMCACFANGARAQVSEGWFGVENVGSGSGADHSVETAYWDATGGNKWIFATGFVTDGSYTRLAVWKYNATAGAGLYDPPAAVAYFPPLGTDLSGNTRATGIAIIPRVNGQTHTAEIYVTGYTQLENTGSPSWPQWGSDYNYITMRFNQNLVPSDGWPGPGSEDGFVLYDRDGNDDKAVDIVAPDDGFVYVTGTSYDADSANDIATLKIDIDDGTLSTTWPAGTSLHGSISVIAGERRFDLSDGDDTAAQMQYIVVAEEDKGDGEAGIWVFVAGTSFHSNGNSGDNDTVVLAYDTNGQDASDFEDVLWLGHAHDSGDHDVAVSLAALQSDPGVPAIGVYVSGYSVVSGNVNYVTVAYHPIDGEPIWDNSPDPVHRYWNGPGNGTDNAAASAWGGLDGDPSLLLIWITGRSANGGTFDAGTVIYDAYTGDEVCSGVLGVANGTSGTPASIAADLQSGAAYVTGITVNGGVQRALTFRISLEPGNVDPTCDSAWQIQYPLTGSRSPSAGLHVLLTPDGIYVAGHTDVATYATDAVTVRYTE